MHQNSNEPVNIRFGIMQWLSKCVLLERRECVWIVFFVWVFAFFYVNCPFFASVFIIFFYSTHSLLRFGVIVLHICNCNYAMGTVQKTPNSLPKRMRFICFTRRYSCDTVSSLKFLYVVFAPVWPVTFFRSCYHTTAKCVLGCWKWINAKGLREWKLHRKKTDEKKPQPKLNGSTLNAWT